MWSFSVCYQMQWTTLWTSQISHRGPPAENHCSRWLTISILAYKNPLTLAASLVWSNLRETKPSTRKVSVPLVKTLWVEELTSNAWSRPTDWSKLCHPRTYNRSHDRGNCPLYLPQKNATQSPKLHAQTRRNHCWGAVKSELAVKSVVRVKS